VNSKHKNVHALAKLVTGIEIKHQSSRPYRWAICKCFYFFIF